MRILSASIPATRNQRNAVTPYMIPIRLWSTVVIQLQIPVGSGWAASGRGAANVAVDIPAPSGSGGGAFPRAGSRARPGRRLPPRAPCAWLATGGLLQRLQVGHDVGDLLLGQVQVGHLGARL